MYILLSILNSYWHSHCSCVPLPSFIFFAPCTFVTCFSSHTSIHLSSSINSSHHTNISHCYIVLALNTCLSLVCPTATAWVCKAKHSLHKYAMHSDQTPKDAQAIGMPEMVLKLSCAFVLHITLASSTNRLEKLSFKNVPASCVHAKWPQLKIILCIRASFWSKQLEYIRLAGLQFLHSPLIWAFQKTHFT